MNADRQELSRYRAALTAHSIADSAMCPRPERIWEAARGELRPRQVAELADHTLACADCSLAWQLALELDQKNAPRNQLRRPAAPLRRPQVWGGLLAAAAAVLLVVAFPWKDLGQGPTADYRGGNEIEVLVSPDETLSRQNCVLSWTSPWPEATYSVTVRDENFGEITQVSNLRTASDSDLVEVQIPPRDLADVAPGTRLYFYVEATRSDGAVLDDATSSLIVN